MVGAKNPGQRFTAGIFKKCRLDLRDRPVTVLGFETSVFSFLETAAEKQHVGGCSPEVTVCVLPFRGRERGGGRIPETRDTEKTTPQ